MKGWLAREDDVPDTSAPASNVIRLPVACVGAHPLQESGSPADGRATGAWPAARLAAVEALWGDGFTVPGGAPEALRLAKPLGLSEHVTLLLLGGGLGGAAQAIGGGTGCWVTSLEADRQLRHQAARRCRVEDRIVVGEWDRHSPHFPPGSAHRVLSLEALRGGAPTPLLESLAAALHPGGQMVVTELVADERPGGADREFAAWCRLDDRSPELPRSEEVSSSLQRLGFTIRLQEDLSDRHVGQTLDGWRRAVRALANGPRPTNHTAAAFVAEAELWLLRIRLMRRLGVRLMRWHAVTE